MRAWRRGAGGRVHCTPYSVHYSVLRISVNDFPAGGSMLVEILRGRSSSSLAWLPLIRRPKEVEVRTHKPSCHLAVIPRPVRRAPPSRRSPVSTRVGNARHLPSTYLDLDLHDTANAASVHIMRYLSVYLYICRAHVCTRLRGQGSSRPGLPFAFACRTSVPAGRQTSYSRSQYSVVRTP